MPADPRRVKELFVAALDVADPGDRDAFLDRECGTDADLRHRLGVLLRAHDHPESALDRPPGGPAGPGTAPYQPGHAAEVVGSLVAGRYKLLERIGEGGMGEVWVADQLEPIRRRVALKLIKPGLDSRSVVARFEAERQALALMDHPNIARVLDAGSTGDGRPFFVMELVKGTPITDFCDARRLGTRERLALFADVCRAIQHAHQKGVIHRDLKPTNVLVELHDDRPVPKVIDFGVAKAVGQQLTDRTLYTGFGALVGTPAYMAPEQATFNALDVDTRADVYALGVLLYELLAGSPPFEPERLRQAALDEVLRVVREEEPPRPSARLSTSQAKAAIAAVRRSDPARLCRLIRGELDWVVMKALAKDRNRRYETAAALARDVERHLTGDAVEARPPTLAYRLRKWARKNRAPLAALGVVFGLVFAWGLTMWSARRESERLNTEYLRSLADALQQAEEANRQRRAAEEREAPLRMAVAEAETRTALDYEVLLRHFEAAGDATGCRALAEMWEGRNRTDAESLYTAARIRATAAALYERSPGGDGARPAKEDADRAMAWLTRAVAAGYDNRACIQADPRLNVLRDREDFRALVAGPGAGGPKAGSPEAK
jgi:serine/threonine protein kinase